MDRRTLAKKKSRKKRKKKHRRTQGRRRCTKSRRYKQLHRKKTHKRHLRKRRRTHRKRAKGGFIWKLPSDWETRLSRGVWNQQQCFVDECYPDRGTKPGNVANCAVCMENAAGLPQELGEILSLWSEHGKGIHPSELLLFLNRHFNWQNRLDWAAYLFYPDHKLYVGRPSIEARSIKSPREWAGAPTSWHRLVWKKLYGPLAERVPLPDLPIVGTGQFGGALTDRREAKISKYLEGIKEFLTSPGMPRGIAVMAYIRRAGPPPSSHYIVLAKEDNQLVYVDPQRKKKFVGMDAIKADFVVAQVTHILFFVASPKVGGPGIFSAVGRRQRRHKIFEEHNMTIISYNRHDFVVDPSGFKNEVFKNAIASVKERYASKLAPEPGYDLGPFPHLPGEVRYSIRDTINQRPPLKAIRTQLPWKRDRAAAAAARAGAARARRALAAARATHRLARAMAHAMERPARVARARRRRDKVLRPTMARARPLAERRATAAAVAVGVGGGGQRVVEE